MCLCFCFGQCVVSYLRPVCLNVPFCILRISLSNNAIDKPKLYRIYINQLITPDLALCRPGVVNYYLKIKEKTWKPYCRIRKKLYSTTTRVSFWNHKTMIISCILTIRTTKYLFLKSVKKKVFVFTESYFNTFVGISEWMFIQTLDIKIRGGKTSIVFEMWL